MHTLSTSPGSPPNKPLRNDESADAPPIAPWGAALRASASNGRYDASSDAAMHAVMASGLLPQGARLGVPMPGMAEFYARRRAETLAHCAALVATLRAARS